MVFGAVGDSIAGLVTDNPQMEAIFAAMGGERGIMDAFFSAVVGLVALVATAYSIRSVLKLRVEEEEQRAEPILATQTPRLRWAASHVVFAVVGPVVILLAMSLVAGVVYGLVTDDLPGQASRALGSALVQLPAVWVLTGLALALFGLAPGLVALSWAALVFSLIVGQLGRILQFPQWILDLSPFTHVPLLPAQELAALPLVVLSGLALILGALGMAGVRRRDIPSV
jgi:ABC-2 type transport system permease protein